VGVLAAKGWAMLINVSGPPLYLETPRLRLREFVLRMRTSCLDLD